MQYLISHAVSNIEINTHMHVLYTLYKSDELLALLTPTMNNTAASVPNTLTLTSHVCFFQSDQRLRYSSHDYLWTCSSILPSTVALFILVLVIVHRIG